MYQTSGMKIVFFDVRPCSFVYSYQVSERFSSSFFRVQEKYALEDDVYRRADSNQGCERNDCKGGLKNENSKNHFSRVFLFFQITSDFPR